jgi:hypothetical protein
MEPLGSYIRQRPRTAAALAFGSLTMAVTHFAWVPEARMNGVAPGLTIAAGLAHALAGAITGRRLLDGTRTHTPPASWPDRGGYVGVGGSVVLTGVRDFLTCNECSLLERIIVLAPHDSDGRVFVSRRRVGAPPCFGRRRMGPLSTSRLTSVRQHRATKLFNAILRISS